jgi:uncharacterized membrane protein YkoI
MGGFEMKSRIAASIVVATLGLAPLALNAAETTTTTKTVKKTTVVESQADLQKEAKITMAKAREIALTKVKGGKIESGEIERENGKLIYSFDIKTSKPGITEVNVNAMTGKIVDVHAENAAKEAAEKKQEAKEKASARQ